MTTQDFLIKNLGKSYPNVRSGNVWCSSVFVDDQGTAYSYGYHYPLATIIGDVAFVNTRGYSMTTSRHISWANSAAAARVGWRNVHSVELLPGKSLTPRDIIESLYGQIDRLNDQLAAKKRTNTSVYRDLTMRRDWALVALEEAMNLTEMGAVV
jgi:hypothetical protein